MASKMLIFDISKAVLNCGYYFDGECTKCITGVVDEDPISCNQEECPLPDYIWKIELLEWIAKNNHGFVGGDNDYVLSRADIIQKIQEL